MSYEEKKVINIGVVSELTGLSVRQIRHYEKRDLIFPERSQGGTRKYSFEDVERLVELSNQVDDVKKGQVHTAFYHANYKTNANI
ncbi:MerR family DNA-binding transcriptional regulator [Ammoniphilus sp. YIM 78166]|uniref:MerR family DNA-binding transcriptional regulator n=1 Tax=Ammoniphilus sp. YIM 78166 TaxID=1644106 RepID=UPI00106F0EBB|nr:MerR family DNA-binding transcriptional regulator [Ammoniphilus sp. YIM 78166]